MKIGLITELAFGLEGVILDVISLLKQCLLSLLINQHVHVVDEDDAVVYRRS